MEAIEILQAADKKQNFEFKPQIGSELASEHEKYLVEHHENVPLFVTDFPIHHKPFYTKPKDADGDTNPTTFSMDLLMPMVGEVIGGTVREERLLPLQDKLQRKNMEQDYQWYVDLRRYGSVPHGGFGMGFERLLQLILGIDNIRDVIPYPRYSGSCLM
jgi:asparaginyl-tRNA synthetase